MAGNAILQKSLADTPATYLAFQEMVMAMADAENTRGKRSLLGKDKGEQAYQAFLEKFKKAVHALYGDNLVDPSQSEIFVWNCFYKIFKNFIEAHPNWPDAYLFAERFFSNENLRLRFQIIKDIRNFRVYLDTPLITRSKV